MFWAVPPFAGTWSDGSSAIRHVSIAGWAYAVHSVDSAKVVDALDRGATRALAEGDRTAPLRVYIQVSLDGDEERGGVDVGRTGMPSTTSAPRPRPPKAWSSSA